MRRTLILLLLVLALGVSTGRAQSVVLVPSRNDAGALCLARVTLDANDAVEAIDTFELPLILGRPANGIEVHPSGRILLTRWENTVANPNDALDWVTVSAGPLTYEDALTWRGLAPEDWVLEPMNASERKRLWSQARREIDAHLRMRPGMVFTLDPGAGDIGALSRHTGLTLGRLSSFRLLFGLAEDAVPAGYVSSTSAIMIFDYAGGRTHFLDSSQTTPQAHSLGYVRHDQYFVGTCEENLQATMMDSQLADRLAPGILGKRAVVYDSIEDKTLESEPFYVGLIGSAPAISPDGRWLLFSGSDLPFGAGKLPHGGNAVYLIDTSSRESTRLTPADVRSHPASWFPDSQRFLVSVYDKLESRSADYVAVGNVRGGLTKLDFGPDVTASMAVSGANRGAWSPAQDRFIGPVRASRPGEEGTWLELRRTSIEPPEFSVLASIPSPSTLKGPDRIFGEYSSLAWLFPSAAPSAD